jgi:hypothetical protein
LHLASDSENENVKDMLQSISWSQYLILIAILLICYYTAIVILYFKLEMLQLFGITKMEPGTTFTNVVLPEGLQGKAKEPDEDYLPKTTDTDITPLVNSFTDEVEAYLNETSNRKVVKEEVLYSLQTIALKYPALKDADCNSGLKQFVLEKAAASLPGISLQDEIQHLWYPLK